MHSASTGSSQPSANASQPSATSAVPPDGSSGAPQSAALTSAQQALVDDIESFGRMPKRKKGTSADDRAENNLAQRYEKLEKRCPLPKHKKQELRVLGGAPQPAAWSKGRELIDAVKTLGFFPKETRPTGDEGMQEFQLALKIRRCQFTPAERIEIDELRRTSVHPRDRAMDFPFARQRKFERD